MLSTVAIVWYGEAFCEWSRVLCVGVGRSEVVGGGGGGGVSKVVCVCVCVCVWRRCVCVGRGRCVSMCHCKRE